MILQLIMGTYQSRPTYDPWGHFLLTIKLRRVPFVMAQPLVVLSAPASGSGRIFRIENMRLTLVLVGTTNLGLKCSRKV